MQKMLKLSLITVLALIMVLLSGCGDDTPTTTPVVPEEMEEMEETGESGGDGVADIVGEIRDISSTELVAEMGVGWNLGNSFDVRSSDKTDWGNPLPTSDHIGDVKAMGFSTLRIPVTWSYHMNAQEPYSVDKDYLERLKEIVNAGLQNDMHVIINTHHDDWIIPTSSEAPNVNDRLERLWTQVANHFIAYGDKLIFEVMNEPRHIDTPEEWSGGTAEGRTTLNEYIKVCVDAIRATGRNNATRHIMIPTYAASTTSAAFADLVIPDDPNIIISNHSYFPWSFAGQDAGGTDEWGSDAEKTALDNELDRIRNRWVAQEGRPVILGEWGAKNKNNLSTRVAYAEYYTRGAVERGMVPIIWDDGGDFGLYDRNATTWQFPEIAEAVVKAGM